VGTSLLHALAGREDVDSIVGIARRRPSLDLPKTEWVAADVVDADLTSLFHGADAVVHLAWLIQPGRDQEVLARVNVGGSSRVFKAVADAGIPSLIYASSVGAYSPGLKEAPGVDESWPTDGIPTSTYSRQKSKVERLLDSFEVEHGDVRVVRMRPGLIFKREAATGIRRLFAGPLLPSPLVDPSRILFVPDIDGLRFQAVHSDDVADAYARAVTSDVRGAFNLAADPILDPTSLAQVLDARKLPMSPRVARAAAALSFRLNLQPSEPGWLDMGLGVPIMDSSRARSELEWTPRRSSAEALRELLSGMAKGEGAKTPPLDPATSGPLRVREFLTGIGRRGG
jgi:UDP-glucose 4-epimerase